MPCSCRTVQHLFDGSRARLKVASLKFGVFNQMELSGQSPRFRKLTSRAQAGSRGWHGYKTKWFSLGQSLANLHTCGLQRPVSVPTSDLSRSPRPWVLLGLRPRKRQTSSNTLTEHYQAVLTVEIPFRRM